MGEAHGTSFVIEHDDKLFLLTNYHIVRHNHYVQVVRNEHGGPTRYKAVVVYEDAYCDLALLDVESESFWTGLNPISFFEEFPRIHSRVTCVGYAKLGRSVSFTTGVFSRFEMRKYTNKDNFPELLVFHTDAHIYGGNSGGPVLEEGGECVGVAFKSTITSPSQGSIIPHEVVEHFLDHFSYRPLSGFLEPGFRWQTLNDPFQRLTLKIDETIPGGVLVKPYLLTAPCLVENDIILNFDKYPLDSNGLITFREGQKIPFTYLLMDKSPGYVAEVHVLRDGRRKNIPLTLQRLEEASLMDMPHCYFILAGMVFTSPSPSTGQVTISTVFNNKLIDNFIIERNSIVSKFNGEPVDSIQDLFLRVFSHKGDCLKFLLNGHYTVHLPVSITTDRNPDLKICQDNMIPNMVSSDLRQM